MNHGHVTPNADGSKARCGGPGICSECSVEFSRKNTEDANLSTVAQDVNRYIDSRIEKGIKEAIAKIKGMDFAEEFSNTLKALRKAEDELNVAAKVFDLYDELARTRLSQGDYADLMSNYQEQRRTLGLI